MPADLEFLVRESRNWFALSAKRRIEFEQLYSAINNGAMPLKLVQLVKTRWLAWDRAIQVQVKQWLELKSHFNLQVGSLKPSDKCTIGRKLRDLYYDESNLLYLLFLKPITAEIIKLNSALQAASAEVRILTNY